MLRSWFSVLIAAVSLAACGGPATEPDLPTLTAMERQLSRSLTPSLAEQRFGPPDQVTGSGLLVYVYPVEAGHSVYLGFPGHAPILYAKLRSPDGLFRDLPLPG